MPKKYIIVRIQSEGLHCWPEAHEHFKEVGFLSSTHRHIFHIEVKKEVTHNDRDIEIIMFKRRIEDFLNLTFYDTKLSTLQFGRMSCEDIAELLCTHFKCSSVTVLEDNENGAVYEQ